MIGNDVVDLLQSRQESNWRRRGFIEKLFTVEEQLLIRQYLNHEIMVWILWSMKEAAYKIYNRQTKLREFIPKKLICKIISNNNNCITGEVICGKNVYYTKTTILNDCINTIAVSNFNDFNKVVEIERTGIIKDQYGIPYLNNYPYLFHHVSISHHGRFEKVVTIL